MRVDRISEMLSRSNLTDNISMREMYRKLNYEHGLERGIDKNTYHITRAYDQNLVMIEEFMRMIAERDDLPYSYHHNNPRRILIKKPYRKHMEDIPRYLSWYNDRLKYSPYVQLFFEQTDALRVLDRDVLKDPSFEIVSGMTAADFLNGHISRLRDSLLSQKFRDQLRHRDENGYRSFRSSVRYIGSLFNSHARLLHIRIDLALKANESGSDADLFYLLNSFKYIRRRITLRKTPFKNLVGYIAHIEYGQAKGHHIHVSLFYDGSKVRNEKRLSRLVGEYWYYVTEGSGIYYTTNLDLARPRCEAIGMIHRDDSDKRLCLLYVTWYITKSDQFLTFKYEENQRLFFRGEIY